MIFPKTGSHFSGSCTIGAVAGAAAVPTYRVHVGEQLPWFDTHDTLPRCERGKAGNAPVRVGPRP